MPALLALAPGDMPRIGEVHADMTVLAFAFGLSIVTGLAIGIVPAFAASRPQLQSALTASGRGSTAGRGQRRVRSVLVTIEIGLAVVLTLGAGLLLRSFLSVLSVDPGFRPDNLLTMQIALPNHLSTPAQRQALYDALFARLDALPGVTASGGTTRLPLGSTNVTTKIGIEGRDVPPGQWPEVEFRRAVHDYFTAMGIPVLRGRGFDAIHDGPGTMPVVVINQTLARQQFRGEDPVGRRLRMSPTGSWLTIVGVIGDVRHAGLEAPPSPEMYVPGAQGPPSNPFIVLRTSGDPAALAGAARAEVQSVDKTIAAYDIKTMTQIRSESVSQRRFVLLLVSAFGVLALVMAAVGVYGVMALIVAERTAEIGIRIALGAQPGSVLRLVVGGGVALASIGIAGGVLVALAMTPLLRAQLYGIGAMDPLTMAAVPALLLAVAAIACWLPARRAMNIDPVNALRV
jgi:predicted permease